MNALRHRLELPTWIALVAVLALALLPTVTRAMAVVQGERAPWAEVCSAQRGPRVVAGDAGDAGDAGGAPMAAPAVIEHCLWCSLGGPEVAPPPGASGFPAPTVAGAPPAPHAAAVPVTQDTWAPSRARAPPAQA